MDIAYDRIQEEALSPEEIAGKERDNSNKEGEGSEESQNLNTELAQAYKAFSSSPWGARFGAFVGNVKKQGETYYEGARQEYTQASSQASKGLTEIINRTRSISLSQADQASAAEGASTEKDDKTSIEKAVQEGDTEGVLARFRSEAFKRLKDIERAEDAADEALSNFFTHNVRDFLRDAVTIVAPGSDDAEDAAGKGRVLFESKDQEGKRVIHSTRFDATLHVIHSSLDSFTKEPASDKYESWAKEFSVDSKTEGIAHDLDKYKELRSAMETLVPDKVSYEDFWTRYYFLRHVVETEEQRRKELLKGAAAEDEEIAWDEDSDAEASGPTSPRASGAAKHPSAASSTTLHPNTNPATEQQTPTTTSTPAAEPSVATENAANLKPSADSSRKSNDQHSQPDSDASYDVVSGVPSAAPGSPKQPVEKVQEDSDEEDWE
ncbi:MAG: translation termination factor GTPase eRF3 [Chaenotheca gracillima]|nr:MAG: translation termination factor GTPase eRF3 [Chaenotheca gracillima]